MEVKSRHEAAVGDSADALPETAVALGYRLERKTTTQLFIQVVLARLFSHLKHHGTRIRLALSFTLVPAPV